MSIKAWKVFDDNFSDCSSVVFAETRNKAKSIALHCDSFEDSEYIDIRAYRFTAADVLYRGNDEIDWDNDDDRLFLVKHGWSCYDTSWECENCCARKYCHLKNEEEDYINELIAEGFEI